jgi:hypothetical protein
LRITYWLTVPSTLALHIARALATGPDVLLIDEPKTQAQGAPEPAPQDLVMPAHQSRRKTWREPVELSRARPKEPAMSSTNNENRD